MIYTTEGPQARGGVISFQLAITTPQLDLIGYGTATSGAGATEDILELL